MLVLYVLFVRTTVVTYQVLPCVLMSHHWLKVRSAVDRGHRRGAGSGNPATTATTATAWPACTTRADGEARETENNHIFKFLTCEMQEI